MPWKTTFFIAIGLAVGFSAAAWVELRPAARLEVATTFDSTAPLEDRVQALEYALGSERYARQLLQDELLYLTAEIEELNAGRSIVTAAEAEPSAATVAEPPRFNRSSRNRGEDRVAQLERAGFSAGQAEAIAQREAELQMAALQARYEAGQSGDMATFYRSRGAIDDTLRTELGEADYERYLAATGQSTSVAVGSIIESSPAQRAGLQHGDRIVRYDGQRVYGMSDLTRQTLDGTPGEQIMVDILRDGMPMQVVLPRGPLGISGGRRY